MSANRPDDERIAELLDGGRLTPEQRDKLLAYLVASDDDYDVFTETAALLQQIEDENA